MARSCLLTKTKRLAFLYMCKKKHQPGSHLQASSGTAHVWNPSTREEDTEGTKFRVILGHKGSSRQPKLRETRPQTTKVSKRMASH